MGIDFFFFEARVFTCSPTTSLAWSALLLNLWSSIDARDVKGSAQVGTHHGLRHIWGWDPSPRW